MSLKQQEERTYHSISVSNALFETLKPLVTPAILEVAWKRFWETLKDEEEKLKSELNQKAGE